MVNQTSNIPFVSGINYYFFADLEELQKMYTYHLRFRIITDKESKEVTTSITKGFKDQKTSIQQKEGNLNRKIQLMN